MIFLKVVGVEGLFACLRVSCVLFIADGFVLYLEVECLLYGNNIY